MMSDNPQSNSAWEEKVSWFKSSQVYRNFDRIDCEPIDFEWNICQKITTMQLCNKVHEFMIKNIRSTRRIDRTDHLHVDVQWHLMEIWRKKRNCNANADLFKMQQDSHQEDGHSSDLDQKEVVFYSCWQTRRIGQSLNWCWSKSENANFPSHESIVPRNAEKPRWWKIINTLLCWWWYDWNCSSHNCFCSQLSICGAVSDLCDEYRIRHVRKVRLVLAEESDPLFESASLTKTPFHSTERVERPPQQYRVIRVWMMQDSWQQLKSDSTSWQKTL